MIKKILIAKMSFGWSVSSWSYVFSKMISHTSVDIANRENLRVLEIGATSDAIVTATFQNLNATIEVSCYQEHELKALHDKISIFNKTKSNYVVMQRDILDLQGSYDVIIMKSVLGGLFRTENNKIYQVNDLLMKIASRNLLSGGMILTIDNGYSFAESILQRFGARKNNWTFFKVGEIKASKQVSFGVVSCCSFSTRWGVLGLIIDELIAFPLDLFLSKIFKRRPTIIGSIITNNEITNDQKL